MSNLSKSKKVIIKRKEVPQLPGMNQDSYLPRIGGFFSPSRPALTDEEKIKYLPSLINVTPDSNDWYNKTAEYFKSIAVPIHYNQGKELEIGLTYTSKEDYDNEENGYPIDVEDYVLYRHCLVLGSVANTKADSDKSQKILFYIEDPELIERNQAKEADEIVKAMTSAGEIMGSETRMRYVLSIALKELEDVWITNPVKPISEFKEPQLRINIADLAQKQASTLNKLVKDPNLEVKAFLVAALNNTDTGVIQYPNSDIIVFRDGSEDIQLGKNINEAVNYLKNSNNSTTFKMIRSRVDFFSWELAKAKNKAKENTPTPNPPVVETK